MKSKILPILILLFSTVQIAVAHEKAAGRADGHAPIGVMGDHLHKQGEWMFSYRFMDMHMKGNLSGSDDISPDEIALSANPLAGEAMRMGYMPDGSPRVMKVPPTYRIAPLKMDMSMHMFGAMYGINDNVTIAAMLNYLEKEMTLQTYGGPAGTNVLGTFTGKTSGIGDTKISAMVKLYEKKNQKLHANLGLSLPTGSITEDGSVLPPFAGMMTPAGETVSIDRLAYPMQLGSGSYEFIPGITYNGRKKDVSWGSQALATLRLNENKENYKLGNRLELNLWAARQWQPWISTSLRVNAFTEASIDGRDDVITGGMPLFAAENSGRDEVDVLLGLNLLSQKGFWKGNRLAAEIGTPVYQKVNGIQMKHDWSLWLGWQKAL